MKDILRCGAFIAGLSLLAGCAGAPCEYLTYEDVPVETPPLVLPAGVTAPPDDGEYRLPPPQPLADIEGCAASPPMTLPPEVLIDPEESEEDGADEPEEGAGDTSPESR